MKKPSFQSFDVGDDVEKRRAAMAKKVRSLPPPHKREFVLEEPKKDSRPPDPVDFESLRDNPLDEEKDGAHIPSSSQWDIDV